LANLASRVLVVVVALPVVLWLVWLGGWPLFGLVVVGALLALHELYAMTRPLRPLVLAGYAGAVAALLGVQLGGPDWMVGGILATLALAFMLQVVAPARRPATVAFGTTVLSVIWIPVGLAHALLLRDLPEDGRLALFTVLLAVFAADTLAYFVGRLIGRHKLAPAVSPGKTWEGLAGGVAGAVLVCFFALYDEGFMDGWRSLVLGGVVAISALLGDLFESLVKRDMGVKDSGRILAGHGGVLDRIDALLFALPASYYLVLAFGFGG
jgi:phosphatidate cytidylyltransferase